MEYVDLGTVPRSKTYRSNLRVAIDVNEPTPRRKKTRCKNTRDIVAKLLPGFLHNLRPTLNVIVIEHLEVIYLGKVY